MFYSVVTDVSMQDLTPLYLLHKFSMTRGNLIKDTQLIKEESRPAPLTHTQRSLWFIQQLVPDSPIYNIFRAWRIVGDPNVAALRKAVALILTRHQSLQTCVRLVNGEPVQMIPDAVPDMLEYRDIRDQPEAADADAIEAWMAAESRKSIDLENGPVFRAKLLRVGDGEHLFFFGSSEGRAQGHK